MDREGEEINSVTNAVYHRDLSHASDGRRYWRSLDELAQTPEFIERLHREFPSAAAEWEERGEIDSENDPSGELSRRNFLTVMGASIALAGLAGAGCRGREPVEKIVPYVNQPENVVPGQPLLFATTLTIDGCGYGALVESHEGRPTKIEGNPLHPASLGAASSFMQASILTMYDPDRSRSVTRGGVVSTWDQFLRTLEQAMAKQTETGGAGLRILSEPLNSPTLASQVASLKRRFPNVHWHTYSPCDRAAARAGGSLAFGRPVNVIYRFDRADVILSLDSDFLQDETGHLRYARHFIDKRRVRKDSTDMNRLYVLESTRTITGAMADHRLPVLPDQMATIASSLATLLGAQQMIESTGEIGAVPVPQDWLMQLVSDLRAAGKAALVIPGPTQSPEVHAACHAINAQLGAVGNTVYYTEPLEYDAPDDPNQSLSELVTAMNAGNVQALFILGGNPVYNAPIDLNFSAALEKVPLCVRHGLYEDETSARCHWHLPMTHELEHWSDARAFDGTISIVQPLIAPLYEGRNVHELISMLLGELGRPSYEIVRGSWQQRYRGPSFEAFWLKSLHDGVVRGSALPELQPRLGRRTNTTPRPTTRDRYTTATGVRIIFRADPSIGDGTWANNGWLQELPKPITRLTWDNAALLSPATAKRMNLTDGDLVELRYRGRTAKAPVVIIPGQPDECATIHLGYGRSRAGRVGTNIGFNAFSLRTTTSPWFDSGLAIVATGAKYPLAKIQHEQLMHGRDLVRVRDIADFRKHPAAQESHHGGAKTHALTLFPSWDYSKGNKWGMAIDTNACIGCNACVTACQSENNIPVVGKDQVQNARIMHWLRIDTYFASEQQHANPHAWPTVNDHATANPDTYFQPVPCMHCENAPCELVCPTGATVHDVEGTNNMVYNRCIGTRYCSNNCPYKVRRFNWFEYNGNVSATEALMKNPNVTVRSRGVMEKCTFCIQRINRARIDSKKNNIPGGFVLDGVVQTACQQACPTQAITFGNLNDENGELKKLKEEPTNYVLLEELNTAPRVSYLERFRNPNAAIGKNGTTDEHG